MELAQRHYDAECAFNAALAQFQAGVVPVGELSLPAIVKAAKRAFELGFCYIVRQDEMALEVCLRHEGGAEEISSAAADTVCSPALLLAGLLGIPVDPGTQTPEPEQHTDEPSEVQVEHYAVIEKTQSPADAAAEPAAAVAQPAIAAEPDLIGPGSPADLPGDHPSLRLLTPEEVEAAVGLVKVMTPASRKSFTIAFRTAFEVPDNVVRIAGEITQLRHLDFIDRFNLEAAGGIGA